MQVFISELNMLVKTFYLTQVSAVVIIDYAIINNAKSHKPIIFDN